MERRAWGIEEKRAIKAKKRRSRVLKRVPGKRLALSLASLLI